MFNEICRGYEVDGLELDFWRWPILFKPTLDGLPVEAKHVELMNEFMRRVRKQLKEIEDERNRVILIAPRVFDTEDICLGIGLDVRTWLKEGLIDLLVVGGDYNHYSIPVSEWAELSHQYGVPMYPCMYRSQGLERDRALAQHFYACGADGIYTFNFRFPNAVDSVNEIGDPQLIARRDKQYAMSGEGNITHACAPPLLPVRLEPGWIRSVPLLVSDDVRAAAVDEELAELRLTVSLRDFSPQRHEIQLKVNDRRLGKCPSPQAEGDVWHMNYTLYTLHTDVRREPPIVHGSNSIEVVLESRDSSSRDPVTLTGLQLNIRYQ